MRPEMLGRTRSTAGGGGGQERLSRTTSIAELALGMRYARRVARELRDKKGREHVGESRLTADLDNAYRASLHSSEAEADSQGGFVSPARNPTCFHPTQPVICRQVQIASRMSRTFYSIPN